MALAATHWEDSDAIFLVFEISERLCAIRAGDVQEILFMAALDRLPGQPGVLEGFLNLRGAAVPVLHLNRLFDLSPAEPRIHTPVIVVRRGESLTGLIVERVREIARSNALQRLPEDSSFNGCAEAQFAFEGAVATALAVDRILLAKESRCISDLQAKAQAYLDDLRERTAC